MRLLTTIKLSLDVCYLKNYFSNNLWNNQRYTKTKKV